MRTLRSFSILAMAAALFLASCGGGGGGSSAPPPAPTPAPTLTSLSPSSGGVGTTVTLTGTNLTGATSVTFNQVSATFTVASATQITTTVPSGATSGYLSVTTPGGTVGSPSTFTVTTAPTVTGFSPANGVSGTVVTVDGTGFTGVTAVKFGTVSATFTVQNSTRLTVTVPTTAADVVPLAVTTAGGTATSTGTFTVKPTVTTMNPTQGPIGTPVVLNGTGFTNASTVSFNGTAATTLTVQSPTQLTATVPSGATTGAVSLGTAGGNASAGTFTVGGTLTLDLSIDGMYLTQSSQTYTGTVPLVANRDGLLRVFVKANQTNTATPVVRVTIKNGGTTVWTSDITAPGSSVPTAITEGTLTSSWNVAVPGANLQPGYTLLAQVDPGGLVGEADKSNNSFPLNGTPQALNIQTVKDFKVTIFPVALSSGTATVTSADAWVNRLKRMYPLATVDAIVGPTFTPSAAASTLSSDGTGWSVLLGELDSKRVADASTRYYYGALHVSYGSGVAGQGYLGSPTAIGWDKTGYGDNGNYPEVLAHEVGHNFGRYHAPCGNVASSDANWPTGSLYAGGLIGAWGWDPAPAGTSTAVLKVPTTVKDVMGYCSNMWVSDYTYKGVLSFRATSSAGREIGEAQAQECLLISGRILGDRVELEPVFQVLTLPTTSGAAEHRLELTDGAGNVLASVPLEAQELGCSTTQERHFTLAVPVPAGYQGLRILKEGKVLLTRTAGPEAMTVGDFREPALRRMRREEVQVGWDSARHPKVMVRDPRTGEVIAFGREGALTLPTDARELEITFSDGLRSHRQILRVVE